jgi:Anti-sigma factor NepR
MADKIDGKFQAHLGGSLRSAYQPMVAESLPSRLRHLLEALDRRESEVETTSGSELGADGGPTPTVDATAKEKVGRIK